MTGPTENGRFERSVSSEGEDVRVIGRYDDHRILFISQLDRCSDGFGKGDRVVEGLVGDAVMMRVINTTA